MSQDELRGDGNNKFDGFNFYDFDIRHQRRHNSSQMSERNFKSSAADVAANYVD